MAEENGDLTPEGEETLAAAALRNGLARWYKGKLIPVMYGGEDPPADPDLVADPPADPADSRPEWLPSQYKDEQAFVHAHGEAQRKITEQGTELARMRQEMQELASLIQEPAQQIPQGFDPSQHPLIAGAQHALDQGDALGLLAAITALQQQAQPVSEPAGAKLDPFGINQLHEHVARRFEADGEESLQERALEILGTNPVLRGALDAIDKNPNATLGDLEPVVTAAYGEAQRERLLSGQASLAQQQQAAETARQRKIEAQTESGAGPTKIASASEQERTWAAIQGADLGGIRLGNVS